MMLPAPLNQKFGRYELLTRLARGGMAEVYLARMTGAGGFARQLVIKRILPHLVDDPEFVAMFVDEGRIAARLTHPNVCQVHELGEVDGDMFLAMEYLEGLSWGDLSPLVPRDGGFELRCAAGVLGQICEGLGYAHELRDVDGSPTPVVHRDVSPQNLMVTTDGVCKLLDFGVSKVVTEGSRTRTGMLKGKLPYMAPEQIRGEPVDPRSDVFAMGIVLWEALTGARLFQRDNDYLIWRAVTEGAIPPVTARQPRLPGGIDAMVARALERDPARRYPTIREFSGALRAIADRVGGPLDQPALAEVVRSLGAVRLAQRAQQVSHALGRPIKDRSPPGAAPAARPAATTEPSPTRSIQLRGASVPIGRRARRSWRWLVAGAIAMVVGGSLAALWRRAHEPAPGGTGVMVARAPADASQPPEAVIDAVPEAVIDAPGDPPGGPPIDAAAPGGDDGLVEIDAPATATTGDGNPRRRPSHGAGKKPGGEPAAAEPGLYSVDSKPYATIFIDGRSYGETPLFKLSLPPGKHRIRAVRMDGRVQRHTVTIEPGKLTSSGTLAW